MKAITLKSIVCSPGYWVAIAGGAITVAILISCQALSQPLPPDPTTGEVPQVPNEGIDLTVPVDLDGDGQDEGSVGIVLPPPVESETRDATTGDAIIDVAAGVGGAVSGNPFLWASLAQLARLGMGLFSRKKQVAPA